jgi:hypothetical protein
VAFNGDDDGVDWTATIDGGSGGLWTAVDGGSGRWRRLWGDGARRARARPTCRGAARRGGGHGAGPAVRSRAARGRRWERRRGQQNRESGREKRERERSALTVLNSLFSAAWAGAAENYIIFGDCVRSCRKLRNFRRPLSMAAENKFIFCGLPRPPKIGRYFRGLKVSRRK